MEPERPPFFFAAIGTCLKNKKHKFHKGGEKCLN